MKRCKIGNIAIDTKDKILSFGVPFSKMRQNQIRIISYLDLLQEKANFTDNEKEIKSLYSEMDKYFCLWQICENLAESDIYLYNALYVFNQAVKSGKFDINYSDEVIRNNKLNDLVLSVINDSINYCNNEKFSLDPNLISWWQENIIDLNYYEINGFKYSILPDNSEAITGTDFDFVGKFKETASAWCYTKVDKSVLSASNIATLKRAKQIEVQNTLASCGVQLDMVTQNNLIEAGILSQTNGGTALDIVNELKAGNNTQIGIPAAVIAAIITACVTIFTTIVAAVISSKSDLTNTAKNTLNNGSGYLANKSDWSFGDIDGDGTDDTNKILLLGAAVLALYYFFA